VQQAACLCLVEPARQLRAFSCDCCPSTLALTVVTHSPQRPLAVLPCRLGCTSWWAAGLWACGLLTCRLVGVWAAQLPARDLGMHVARHAMRRQRHAGRGQRPDPTQRHVG
jgi:hypothetical protein